MQTIGKYQVQHVLGHGGMGTVYEALDPLINRKVAVKTMIQGLAESPELRARFLREAQAAGNLHHRNIVTVYDLGEDKGQPFIAMEFIEGTDLEKIIQNKEPLSVEWKLDVIRQICDGLAYAHRNGIVHRDIKPANIRVTPEGEVKIMDFGIAHLQSSTMTKSGLVLGTVHYMAPEQVQGQKVDHRADIFSVGAIAYELVAYRRPFDAESLTGVMFKIMHEGPDLATLPKTDYSPGLEAIIMKALAREPKDRYPSLDEMHGDLEALVRDAAAKAHGSEARQGAARETSEGPGETVALDGGAQRQRVAKAVQSYVEEGRRHLTEGDLGRALECANQALALSPGDEGAQALAREANAESLRKRVENEMGGIRAEMERARSEGHLQKALGLCKRLLELNPEDEVVGRASAEIQAAIQGKEVEQLCGLALSYAADGDTDLALKIAGKIEKLAPASPRYLELKSYLEEESNRKAAEALAAVAGDHLALGNLAEALASAEEALKVRPSHHAAREIRDRIAGILAAHEKQAREAETAALAVAAPTAPGPPAPTPPPRPRPQAPSRQTEAVVAAAKVAPAAAAATATPPPLPVPPAPVPAAPARAAAPAQETLTPLPEGSPANPEAAALLDTARRLLRERAPQKAIPPLEQAAALEPGHPGIQRLLTLTRAEARRSEIESLTTAALNHFVQNNYPKARKAVEKALALDPENKKATELLKILGALR